MQIIFLLLELVSPFSSSSYQGQYQYAYFIKEREKIVCFLCLKNVVLISEFVCFFSPLGLWPFCVYLASL